jgi:hypothetical protein
MLPSELSQLQFVCNFFHTLLHVDNPSTELNGMWKFQYNVYLNNIEQHRQKLKLRLIETLKQPQIKKLYLFCDTSELHYKKVFCDFVETMNSYSGSFNQVYLNSKLMKDILNTKWTYSETEDSLPIKSVFIGSINARTREFLATVDKQEFPEYMRSLLSDV